MVKKNRIDYIDILKGIAIILVVYGHVLKNDNIVNIIYMIHLPIFMFVSGLLFKEEPIKECINKKFKNILIPYLFFSLLCLIYFFLIESKFRNIDLTIGQSILGIVFGYYNYLEFNVHLWYLPFFFMTIILFDFISKKIGRKVAICIYVFLGILYLFLPLNNIMFSLNRFDLMMYFAFGNFIRYLKNVGLNKNNKIVFVCLLLGIFIISFLAGKLNYIVGILGIIITLFLSKFIEKKDIILKKIGRMSLVILCIHGPIYRVLIKIISLLVNVSTELIRQNFVCCSVVVVLTIMLCCISYILLKKINPILIGEKSKI